MTAANVILLWRLHRGYTQAVLSKKAGIPRPNLSDIERGKQDVSLKTVRALAAALGVSPGTIVDGVPPEKEWLQFHPSREALERVAEGVVSGKRLPDPRENLLKERLAILLNSRLLAAGIGKRKMRIGRKADRAWLQLRQLESGIVTSLTQRVEDRIKAA